MKQHTVAAIVFEQFAPFELAVACEVFGYDRSEVAGKPWYRFKLCATSDEPVTAHAGMMSVEVPYRVRDIATADTVIVPAGPTHAPPAVLDALRTAHRRGARIMSVCTGAFVLAEAGLLDGRRATTHWMHAAELQELYPAVDVDPSVLYVDDGDVLTSAGTAAGIDLCLHVVRQDYGAEVANAIARLMVVPPHRDGGQAQYVDQPVACCPDDDPLASVLQWVTENLSEPLTVEDMARRATMSPRTFARRFRAVAGTTPLQWVLKQRVLLAQRMLEATDDPIELIADRVGLGTAANLRVHFQRTVGTSPLAYRRTFREAKAS